jgi:hypothetical protein
VAVGRRPRNELRANVEACARLVFDDNRLVPAPLKLLPDRACQDIGAGGRRHWNDDGDGASRRLSRGAADCDGDDGGDNGQLLHRP